MEALEVLKAVISKLRNMQFDETQRSPGEAADNRYRAGHNDGVRAAIKECEAHIGVVFTCARGCGWNARGKSAEVNRLMRCYGRCPGVNSKPCGGTVEMAEVAL